MIQSAHKAIPYNNGVLTIGAETATLKHWVFDGKWDKEEPLDSVLGGKFNRLKDIEALVMAMEKDEWGNTLTMRAWSLSSCRGWAGH